MAIAKKPIKNSNLTDKIINKGGGSPFKNIHDENTYIKITLRLSSKMMNVIDEYLLTSINKKSRTCWLREAIEEKMKKEII